jgi:YHS domain-containing protein
MVQSAIDKVHSEWFLTVLLPVDQAEHQATIPQLNADDARYWWVFRNLDFMTWDSAESPGLFWLSGLPHRNIDQISSYIIDREKAKHSGSRKAVLYFFCSTFADESSAQLNFTHTLLHQLASSLLITGEATVLIKQFLRSLHQLVFKDQWDALGFQETDTPRQSLAALLGAPSAKHWAALKAALPPSIKHDLIIVIDGVDNVGKATLVFLREVCTFIKSLQYKGFKLKVLITSQGLTEIKDFLAGVPSIVFDDERKRRCCISNC